MRIRGMGRRDRIGSSPSDAERADRRAVEKLTVRLAEGNTIRSNIFAKQVISYILKQDYNLITLVYSGIWDIASGKMKSR